MYAIFTQYTKTAIKNHVFGKNFEKKKNRKVLTIKKKTGVSTEVSTELETI